MILQYLHAEKVQLSFKIYQILKIRETCFSLGKFFILHSFSTYLRAYCGKEKGDLTVLQPSDVIDQQLLDLHTSQDGQSYLSLKYHCFS